MSAKTRGSRIATVAGAWTGKGLAMTGRERRDLLENLLVLAKAAQRFGVPVYDVDPWK